MSTVEFSNVSFFSDGLAIIDELSFILPEHKLTAILGRPGSGKIVVPKLIGGILLPSKGSVVIDGEDSKTTDDGKIKQIRSKISYIFRNGGLISNLGVEENIRLSLDFHCQHLTESEKKARISWFLKYFQLPETILPKRPANLTRSEQKLVGFIRGMIIEPEVVLIDEPLENCEPNSQRLVLNQIMENKSKGLTQTIISQSLEQILPISDFILVLDKGKIIELDTRENILNSKNTITHNIILDYYMV